MPIGLDSLHSDGLDNIEMSGGLRTTHNGVQCPNCHIVMASSTQFDRLDYLCNQCRIMVHLPKEWAMRYLHLR